MAGVPIQIKRGTRAGINALATAGELRAGEPYLITDESRIAVGTSATTYQTFAQELHNHSASDITDVGSETISTSAPSGGASGDKWFQVS